MSINNLKAVFWDYPELCDPETLRKTLNESRLSNDDKIVHWIMARFLERGRIRDTASFFRPAEIREKLDFLKISHKARKRWQRLLEVYWKFMSKLIKEDITCYASETQEDVLSIISGSNVISEHFFITGGTALSVFYLHHRVSEDIDLFSMDYRDLDTINETVKRMFRDDLAIIQSSPEFYSYLIREVKVDIVFDPLSIIGKRPVVNLMSSGKIPVDTLDNICSKKLCTMASRFEPKDIIDFFFISKTIWKGSENDSFSACYEMARKKEALLDDPAMAAYQIEELLTMMLSEKEKVLPSMKAIMDWDSFERDIRYYIDLIYRMHHW